MSTIETILSQLHGVEGTGEGYAALCPAHDDRSPSLSISEGDDGRVLLHCHAGCLTETILQVLGREWQDLFAASTDADLVEIMPSGDEGHADMREQLRARGWVVPKPGKTYFDYLTATVQPRGRGCTLEDYSREKMLPRSFLAEIGLAEGKFARMPAVKIPYLDSGRSEAATRYRTALTGDDRFRWKKGDKPTLYGLWRLADARSHGFVVLVEGETDCQTLWLHGIPAIGLPGASQWSEEQHLIHFTGISKVYLFVERDAGGETLLRTMAESKLADRILVIRLDDRDEFFKDPSAIHVWDDCCFDDFWQEEVAKARPLLELIAEQGDLEEKELWEQCHEIATTPNILGAFADELARTGVAGEERASKLLYLVVTSRFLGRPISAAVKGPSSAGKSYIVEQVLRFFPSSAWYALTAMSERALAYFKEPLKHRVLVLYEAAGIQGELATYFIRSLLSESQVRYATVERFGQHLRTVEIVVEGPTGLLVTTTQVALHPENETRILSIPVNDTSAQTERVLLALASERDGDVPDLSEWIAFQSWLERAQQRVLIPYLRALASSIPALSVRLRRDWTAVVNLIRAHAILHQATRERGGDGEIMATWDDYAAVHTLVADLIASGIEATVPPTIRETVEAVQALATDDGVLGEVRGVQVNQVAEFLHLDKSSASRRLLEARKAGYVENRAGRGRPAEYVTANPLPDDREVLPAPEKLKEAWVRLRGCGDPGE